MGWGGQYGQVVGVIMLFNWCLSGWNGWDGHRCVLLRVGRLVTSKYIWGGKVVGKIRLVGAIRVLVVQTLI